MGYFSNRTEGDVLEHQCSLCKYGEDACPIYMAQAVYNYDACNNEVARKILDSLIANDGTCEMYKTFEKDFSLARQEKEAPSLFEEVFGEE